ncbi:Predicted N-acetyltransferase YhbS [Geodermatophilus saharensis]|uniref:Predicted N-acetyltransferase YhbS n=1 Tax=Geodermatophilus saharensis TaxID=1137994 RepID=A0A239A6K8_9ACTN|nr:GNAT family N-acetyltransferase [Geodermatophilus saharensis]SNR91190.1 Predicted N-acetyltransferase YhbS [Geodermatophilus saharensis]
MALPSRDLTPLTVEDAVRADWPAIAELTVSVYRDERLASEEYLGQLADVEHRAGRSQLLVARDGGRVVGAVALVLDGDFGEVTAGDDEAAFRMLVVDPAVRGRGVGESLVRVCLDRARAAGKRRVVLSTDPRMTAAHRLYDRLGFTRLPGRDWSPRPGIDLLVYVLEL